VVNCHHAAESDELMTDVQINAALWAVVWSALVLTVIAVIASQHAARMDTIIKTLEQISRTLDAIAKDLRPR
jgi:hypothetical protein